MQKKTPEPRHNRAAISAMDSLRSHEKMAGLLPAAMRMAAIQKDCAALLPGLDDRCAVVRFESGQLTLSAPNASVAARLKQKLPKLQDALCASGWQVSAIRLKVQPGRNAAKPKRTDKPALPATAIEALAGLERSLADSPGSEGLSAALRAMLQRHR